LAMIDAIMGAAIDFIKTSRSLYWEIVL